MYYKTRELSSILLLVEDISTKLQQMQQVNYFAYKKESLIEIAGEGLMVYTKRKKKSAGLQGPPF